MSNVKMSNAKFWPFRLYLLDILLEIRNWELEIKNFLKIFYYAA